MPTTLSHYPYGRAGRRGGLSLAQMERLIKSTAALMKKIRSAKGGYKLKKKKGKGKKKYTKKKTGRKRYVRGSSRTVNVNSALSHSALANHYSYNSLAYCVTEDLTLYNSSRKKVLDIPELDDYHKYHDSHVIQNNGVVPNTGEPPVTPNFTDGDVSYYFNLDFTHAVGKYSSSGPVIPSMNITNQIYNMRQDFKKWKKEHLKITLKWSTEIDGLHPLDVPKGYYQVIERQDIKTMLGSNGQILGDTVTDNQIYRVETQTLTNTRVLAHKYGVPTPYTNTATLAGEFPNEAQAALLTPVVPLEVFTYENVNRNSAGWKKIPRTQTMEINVPYKQGFNFTTVNNCYTDPIILFIFENIPTSWLKQETETNGTVTNVAIPGINNVRLMSNPHFSNELVVAKIGDIKIIHCFRFKDRCEDLVALTSAYPDTTALLPY